MSGRYLLDTNILIALFANEAGIRENLASADEIFLPSIAIGELYYGARKSARVAENLQRIDELVATSSVLNCNTGTAQTYGNIKSQLRSKGRPLPENDIWIAAIALQFDLTLVTRDAHFEAIEDLQITRW